LVFAVLGVEDHRQQARPDMAARDYMKGRRRLGDLLARAARELLADGLDHFPLPRHHLQRFGNGLAEFCQLAAAARTGGRAGDYHTLTRQMRRKRRPHRLFAGERLNRRTVSRHSVGVVLSRARRRFLELQFQLVEQLAAAFGGLPILLAPQLGDQQLVVGDQRLGAGSARFRLVARLSLGGQRRFQRVKLIGRVVGRRHGTDCHGPRELCRRSTER